MPLNFVVNFLKLVLCYVLYYYLVYSVYVFHTFIKSTDYYICSLQYLQLLSNCFDSEFCKHIWTKRKLARRAAWHVVRDEWGGVFWLVEKTTCQSGSFNWMNNNLFKRCHVVRLPVSPNVLKTCFVLYNIAVNLYLLFGRCYALFGRY